MARQLATSALGTTANSYLYSLATNINNSTYATISSDDSLTLFDLSLRQLTKFRSAHSGISCLTALPNNAAFTTAGRDGTVRCWDSRANSGNSKSAELTLSSPKGTGISALAASANNEHLIAAGTESTKEGLADVEVLVFDTRNSSAPLIRVYGESHTDSMTQLAFHPTVSAGNVLLSGSEDGLVSVFDASQVEEEDALRFVLNPRGGVHLSGFLGEREVFVCTADERFLVYSLPENLDDESVNNDESAAATASSSLIADVGDVRPLLDCAYVIGLSTPFSPGRSFGGAPAAARAFLAVGNHSQRGMQLVALEDDANGVLGFGGRLDFPGAHGEEVVRDLIVCEREGKVLSCGEDGNVKVWDVSQGLGMSGAGDGGDAMDIDDDT